MLSILDEISKMLSSKQNQTFAMGFYSVIIAALFIFILFSFVWILKKALIYESIQYFVKYYRSSLKKTLPDHYLYMMLFVSGLIIIFSIYIDLYHSGINQMIHKGLLTAIGKIMIYICIILIPAVIIVVINYFTQNFF